MGLEMRTLSENDRLGQLVRSRELRLIFLLSFLFLHYVCPALLLWEVEIEGWLWVDGHVDGTQGMVVWGRDVVGPFWSIDGGRFLVRCWSQRERPYPAFRRWMIWLF